jgi:hypothetical protein
MTKKDRDKKMTTIPLSVEPNTFKMILELSPEVMLELVNTVGIAAMLNDKLASVPENKIIIAIAMMASANAMLEQCNCKIETTINHPSWIIPAIYKTGMENSNE